MSAAIAARRDLLSFPGADVAQVVRQDPAALFDLLRDAVGGSTPGGLRWASTLAATSPGTAASRLLIARPKRPPYDVEFSKALDARLHEIRERPPAAPRRHARPATRSRGRRCGCEFAGGHRIAVETEAVVKRESIWNTVGSLILILPLLYLVFRSAVARDRRVAALRSVAGVRARRYGIHRREACRRPPPAPRRCCSASASTASSCCTSRTGWRVADGVTDIPAALEGPSSSMLLGMWTTAATFYGLMFVDFPSLQQLGRLLGHSMMMCGVLTLVMVPALLPRRAPRRALPALLMPRFAAWMVRPSARGDRGEHRAHGGAGTGGDADPRQPDTRPAALGDQRGADRNRNRTTVRPAERRLRRARRRPRARAAAADQRTPAHDSSTADVPDLAFQSPTRLLPSAAAQQERVAAISKSRFVGRGDSIDARASPRGERLHARRVRSVLGASPAPARHPRAAHLRRARRPRLRRSRRSIRRPRIRPLVDRDLSVSVEPGPGRTHPGRGRARSIRPRR